MLPERLSEISGSLPLDKVTMLAEMNDESKVAASVISASVNLLLAWFVSRQIEGTVNSKWEKRFIVVGSAGLTIGNAIVNHQIWT